MNCILSPKSDIIVLYPFHIPLWIPRPVGTAVSKAMVALRIVPPKKELDLESKLWVRSRLPINLVTAPLIAVLFLLAIGAIGREEVRDGTLGADDIHPLDIMVFFITLAYIAVSIDTSGLIRFLAYKVLQKAGANGRRLFFYLYVFFFALATCVGNDPIVLSGTPFLAYMTRITQNIENPRAWIYMQFAVANIASAILVSSNPTNLVLAGAFNIKFIDYTANMIVPVLVTAIALFPLLLYVIFRQEKLIPGAIKMHELPEEIKNKEPICPNVPYAKGNAESADDGQRELALLEEILNPYLDKRGAAFGFIIMAATLITILVLNAVQGGHTNPVFWITLPAAVVVFSWDVAFGWYNRHDTREIARIGREKVDNACASQESGRPRATGEKTPPDRVVSDSSDNALVTTSKHTTFVSFMANSWSWARETFPTATTVLKLLPFALVPFAFCMFILVQALVTKGWVPVFAHGWNNWIRATGTLGAIGGMAFVSVILCNVYASLIY